ncbi:glycosyltransferase family 4 protein [bacterium]|nr:glycosyltransferase family 4 protein [bacterium]
MKVLHVNNYGAGFGTEKYINGVISSLENRGHECKLFVQEVCGGNHPLKAVISARRNLARLKETVRSMNPDVIHVHNITNYRLLEYLLHAAPVLKSIHEFRPFCVPRRIRPDTGEHCKIYLSTECFKTGCLSCNLGSLYRYFVEKRGGNLIRKFPKFWVYSNFMKEFIDPLLSQSSSVDVVNYYYDPPEETPPDPPLENLVFSAGRLVLDKGYHLFFDAMSKLNITVKIKLAGVGVEEENLRNQAREHKLNVDFLGYHPPSELEKWYRWCKVVVFPSDYPEPFGIVGLEAMGAARPVVAFDVGGISDWLEDGVNGFVVPRSDTAAFGQRVKQLLEEPDLALTMGRKGRKLLLDKFSSGIHIDKLEATYQDLIQAL